MTESFFEFQSRSARLGRKTKEPVIADNPPLTVAQLNDMISAVIRSGVPTTVTVQGEISNLNYNRASGHIYLTLKDERSCIDCVMFKSDVEKLTSIPENGQRVVARGSVRVYTQRGRYQLYITRLTPIGQGVLEAKFRALKEKLEKEGLFDPSRKKKLPLYPQRIVLVTSQDGAAVQDIRKVFSSYPWIRLILCHVPVQGAGSAERIARMLLRLSSEPEIDLIILARGGGSLEDLWEFNSESVARAIADCRVPIITGIGHEVDVSIADLVADYHAHTPTQAAQVAVTHWKRAHDLIEKASERLIRSLSRTLNQARQRLVWIERHPVFRRPTDRINQMLQRLDDYQRQLEVGLHKTADGCRRRLTMIESRFSMQHPGGRVMILQAKIENLGRLLYRAGLTRLLSRKQTVESLDRQLQALNPSRILERGYSITFRKRDQKMIRSIKDIRPGDVLITRLCDGKVESWAKDPDQPELFS